MRKIFEIFTAALMFAALAGCDDQDSGKKTGAAEKRAVSHIAGAQLGAGWQSTAQGRNSAWGFAADPDSLNAVRAALDENMLPPKAAVRIAVLVNRAVTELPPPEAGGPAFRPMAILAPSPWNDDTMLLVVGIADGGGEAALPRDLASAANRPAITVDFDAKAIGAFRPLGDPAALPLRDGTARTAVMIYELSPQPGFKPQAGSQYGVLRVRYRLEGGADPAEHDIERPITAADLVADMDNAPQAVRFAAAVAGFGGLLEGDPAMRDLSCAAVMDLAKGAAEPDPEGVHAQFIRLMEKAEPLIDMPPADLTPAEETVR